MAVNPYQSPQGDALIPVPRRWRFWEAVFIGGLIAAAGIALVFGGTVLVALLMYA